MSVAADASLRLGEPSDDLIQPFQLSAASDGPRLAGRVSRLGPLVDDILSRHDYPEPVAHLLGEALALAATLAGAVKFSGVFTLQAQGDGPVSLVVADLETGAGADGYRLRGYAGFDDAGVAAAPSGNLADLLGSGHLAFTVDQGGETQRYQGIVELVGATLAECAQHHFRQSAQLDAAIMLAAGRDGDAPDAPWRAGGLMLQRIAEPEFDTERIEVDDEPWRRAVVLMATGTSAEMLDPELAAWRFLYRLFHQEGLRINKPRPLTRGCRCSARRIVNVLRSLPRDELDDLAIDGLFEVTCEFCSTLYRIDPADLDRPAGADGPG